MTAMWASLADAYQIYVEAANGKTGATAELTLNMDNKLAIGIWECTLVLPEGVTYKDVAIVDGRYPEGYNAVIIGVPSNDNEVHITCYGEEGVTLTGTKGAVATVTVEIASTVEPKDYIVTVKNAKLTEPNGSIHEDGKKIREFTWTIEQGEEPGIKGDLNGDEKVDIADAVCVLNAMAGEQVQGNPDVNGDGNVDIADFVAILNIMAGGE